MKTEVKDIKKYKRDYVSAYPKAAKPAILNLQNALPRSQRDPVRLTAKLGDFFGGRHER